MFENLSDILQSAVNKINDYGKINEDNISEVTREIRISFLLREKYKKIYYMLHAID